MHEDPRNCGSIACIVNAEGYCWCGLKWDGRKMARAPLQPLVDAPAAKTPARKTAAKAKSRS